MLIPCSVCLIVHTDIIHGCTLLQRSGLIASALSCVIVLGLWNECMCAWVEGAPVWMDVCWLVLSVCVGTDVWAQKDKVYCEVYSRWFGVWKSPILQAIVSRSIHSLSICVSEHKLCLAGAGVTYDLCLDNFALYVTSSSHCSGLGSTLTVELN